MNINEAFPSKYLKVADLQGTEPIVTIDRVEFQPVGQDREMKAVLFFRNKHKGLLLNKTNANKIIEITGTAITEEWEGQRRRLYAAETTFAGKPVECLRIKPAAGSLRMPMTPAPAPAPLTRQPEQKPAGSELTVDDIPF